MFVWDLWREAKAENLAARRDLASAVDAAAAKVKAECGQRMLIDLHLLDVVSGGLDHPCCVYGCQSGARIPLPDVSCHWAASLSIVRADTESVRKLASAESVLSIWRESQLAAG